MRSTILGFGRPFLVVLAVGVAGGVGCGGGGGGGTGAGGAVRSDNGMHAG